jgi:hypothetical protein
MNCILKEQINAVNASVWGALSGVPACKLKLRYDCEASAT